MMFSDTSEILFVFGCGLLGAHTIHIGTQHRSLAHILILRLNCTSRSIVIFFFYLQIKFTNIAPQKISGASLFVRSISILCYIR